MADTNVNNEIYSILSKDRPTEADFAKVSKLIGDNWKEGVPDEFMAKVFPKYESAVKLGGYGEVRADKLSHIMDNLKKYDENNPEAKMLNKFINADNTPNGDTPATYVAHHAVAMQEKLDSGKFSDEDKKRLEPFLAAQKRALQTLADNGADFSKTNKNGQNVEDVARIAGTDEYSKAIEPKFIDLVHAQQAAHQSTVVTEEKEALEVKEQGKLNVGGKEAVKVQEGNKKQETPPEKVADVGRDEKGDSGNSEDYKGPPIKEKDIIDYLYNDVFIYYLNMLSDKIIGWARGKIDNFCDSMREEATRAAAAQSQLKNDQCERARKKTAALMTETAPKMEAAYAAAQGERRKHLEGINADVKANIESGKPVDQWTFANLNPLNPNEARTIVHLKEEYTKDPETFKQRMDLAEKNLDSYMKMDEQVHRLAIRAALIEQANSNLDRSNFDWVNKELDVDKLNKAVEDKKQQIWEGMALASQMGRDQAALANSPVDAASMGARAQMTFLDNYTNMLEEVGKKVMDDVKNERFDAAASIAQQRGITDFKRQGKEPLDHMKSLEKATDTLAKEMKVNDATKPTTLFAMAHETGSKGDALLNDLVYKAGLIETMQQGNAQRKQSFKTSVIQNSEVEHKAFTNNFLKGLNGGRGS